MSAGYGPHRIQEPIHLSSCDCDLWIHRDLGFQIPHHSDLQMGKESWIIPGKLLLARPESGTYALTSIALGRPHRDS